MTFAARLLAIVIVLCLWAVPQSTVLAGDWSHAHGALSVDAIVDASARKDDLPSGCDIDRDDPTAFAAFALAAQSHASTPVEHAAEHHAQVRLLATGIAWRPRAPPA